MPARSDRGRILAAGTTDPAVWMMGTVVPLIRDHFRKHGATSDQGDVYTLRLSMSKLTRTDLGLSGSAPRVVEALIRLGILTRIDKGKKGPHAYPPLWACNMARTPSHAKIRAALLDLADERTAARRERLREDRLAGEYPTQTTGGPVTTTQVPPKHVHSRDMANHAHEGRTAMHHHEADGSVVWIEFRHHTHEAKPEAPAEPLIREPEPTTGPTTSTRREVRDDLTGHPAMVVGPSRDGRYAGLLEIISDLEAEKARHLGRIEWLEGEVRRLADELLQRTDPSTTEADAILQRYGKA